MSIVHESPRVFHVPNAPWVTPYPEGHPCPRIRNVKRDMGSFIRVTHVTHFPHVPCAAPYTQCHPRPPYPLCPHGIFTNFRHVYSD